MGARRLTTRAWYRVADDVARHIDDAAPAAPPRQADAGRPGVVRRGQRLRPVAVGIRSAPRGSHWWAAVDADTLLRRPVAVPYRHYFHSLVAFPSKEAGPDAPADLPGTPALTAGDLPALIHAP